MKKHIHTHLIVNTQINEFKETHQSTITLQPQSPIWVQSILFQITSSTLSTPHKNLTDKEKINDKQSNSIRALHTIVNEMPTFIIIQHTNDGNFSFLRPKDLNRGLEEMVCSHWLTKKSFENWKFGKIYENWIMFSSK